MKRAKNAVRCACGAAPTLILLEDGFTVRCPNTPAWVVNVGHKTEEKAIKHWNDMQNGMDRLSRKAMIALHTGTSYGKFESKRNAQTATAEKMEAPVITGQQKRTVCVCCGKPLPKTRRLYCSDECSDEINKPKRRERGRKKYQKRMQHKKVSS